jgi:hypothetical protein
MWIINENSATQRLFNRDLMDEPVEFSSNGTAQVSEDVGEALVDHYDTIHRKTTDT